MVANPVFKRIAAIKNPEQRMTQLLNACKRIRVCAIDHGHDPPTMQSVVDGRGCGAVQPYYTREERPGFNVEMRPSEHSEVSPVRMLPRQVYGKKNLRFFRIRLRKSG